MTTTIDGDSYVTDPTRIDDTDSPYTTSGEQYIYADTSSGAVTITLASADAVTGKEIRIIDAGLNAATNAITIQTEGSETINPGGHASITLTVDGTYVDLFSDGANWFSDRASEKETIETESATITEGLSADGLVQSNDPDNPKEPYWFNGSYYTPLIRTLEFEVAGDNTAVPFLKPRGIRYNGLIQIHGHPQSHGDNYGFSDILNFAQGTVVSVADSASRNSTGPRSYGFSNDRLTIAIDDAGETYDVGVIATGSGIV